MNTLRDKAVRYLANHVEEILSRQNEKGEFWPDAGHPARWNTDYQQFAYYPLALMFTLDHPANPYKGDRRLLEAVVRSFRNNLAIQNESGEFLASSHDMAPTHHSGEWRSFTWLRAFQLLKDVLEPGLVEACEAGLRRALGAVGREAEHAVAERGFGQNHNVRNHPTWAVLTTFAMASDLGDAARAAWAREWLERICSFQHPAGIWKEHDGPVTVYQHVTMSAISHYYFLTKSPAAKAALDRAIRYYKAMIYPNGHPCEILDGRARYKPYAVSILPAAWALLPEGRSLLHLILDRLLKEPFGPGYQVHGSWFGSGFFATFLRDLPLDEAGGTLPSPLVGQGNHTLPDLPVRMIRRGPWTVMLSAYTTPEMPHGRWRLDYQNHVSIFHETHGLLIGGGNAKRQAAFSTFSGGVRPLGLPALATSGTVEATGEFGARLRLEYAEFTAVLEAEVLVDRVLLRARVESVTAGPVHLQLSFPMLDESPITTGGGGEYEADMQHELLDADMKGTIGRKGVFTLAGLSGARAMLHVLPYNTHWRNAWTHDENAVGIVAQPVGAEAQELVVRPHAAG